MSQSNSTLTLPLIIMRASQKSPQHFTKVSFPTYSQIKMQCVKMILHFTVHYRVSARAYHYHYCIMIIITAVLLHSMMHISVPAAKMFNKDCQ